MDKRFEQEEAGQAKRGKLQWNAPDITKLEFPATASGSGHSQHADTIYNYQLQFS